MCCRLAIWVTLFLVLVGASRPVDAQGRSFRLSAPDALVASGFLKHLLPRFSLKTGVRIELVAPDAEAEARLTEDAGGVPAFTGLGKDWYFVAANSENEHVSRFVEWLTGEVGKKTIEAFKPEGDSLFLAAIAQEEGDAAVVLPGDVVQGEKLAVLHCGRCHMVNEATRLTTIGSSPSFAVMRTFADWQIRFEAFFTLNPHPSFTMIDGVTEPFDASRPAPIVPVQMNLSELEAILAFVAQIPPADLGAPIQYQ